MTRNKKSNAKGLQSHGQGNSNHTHNLSPASSAIAIANNPTRALPENAGNGNNQRKKRPLRGSAKSATAENEQVVHLSPSTKRPRQDETFGSDAQPPSVKKLKRSDTKQPQNADSVTPSAPNGANGPTKNTRPSETTVKHATPEIPSEVQCLASKYDLTPMSVISSSKMEQKVRNVIKRISQFSFNDAKAKPGVVILHAEAQNASKMVTIAELSKRDIEKEKGKWWQYTKLEGHVMEMKEKPRKPPLGQVGKTLVVWEDEQRNGAIGETQANVEMEGTLTEPTSDKEPNDIVDAVTEEEEEEEEAFETMAVPTDDHRGATLPGAARKKIRAVPVMTIYLARVPVPGLRELYGEQTNSLAP